MKAESERDISNVEAWAVLIENMLHLMPDEIHMDVLRLAIANEEAKAKAREKPFRLTDCGIDLLNDDWMKTPGNVHRKTIMRLKSLIVQVFTRNITNNHSPKDAAKLLFAVHPHGDGSGALGDYLDRLPRTADVES